MSGQTPAGWYHDPYGTPGLLRYWDGTQWTQATQPTDAWDGAESAQNGSAPPDSPASGGPASPLGAPVPADTPSPAGFAPPDQLISGGSPSPEPGGSTPPPWRPPADAQPHWNLGGPSTPQPWQAPPPAPKSTGSGTGLLWALGGGGVVLVVLIVLVALFATGALGEDPKPTAAAPPAPSPTVAGPSPSAGSTARSPVVGTITDSGISYARLGGPWQARRISPTHEFALNHGFGHVQVALVQEDYDGRGSSYVASAFSGRLPKTVGYDGPEDLQTAVTDFTRIMEAEGGYPPHTREDLQSQPRSIDGHRAHLLKFRLSFPQAAARGWNFRTETVAFLLVDQGSDQRPSVLWVTVPDSHRTGGDLDLLVESVKVP